MIIGSTAAKYWFPDFREPKDTDAFTSTKLPGIETFWHPSFPAEWEEERRAFPNELYTIKVSHAAWSLKNNSWNKHMHDLLFLLNKGCNFLPDMYEILYPVWEERYGSKKAKIAGTPSEFFNSNITREFEHDSIHESIAYYNRPLFESILKDGEQVAVDYAKFENLSHGDKIRLVREEVYATALERVMIPKPHSSPRAAYAWALQQTITSFWRGKWSLLIVLNYDLVHKPDVDYYEKFKRNESRLRRLSV